MPSSHSMMLTCHQLIYTLEIAESAHLSASAAGGGPKQPTEWAIQPMKWGKISQRSR